jgi:hypothetical protein
MSDLKTDMADIQSLAFEAYKSTGQVLAFLDLDDVAPAGLAKVLDAISGQFEKSAVLLRNLCEKHRPAVDGFSSTKPAKAPSMVPSGHIQVNAYGWIMITLNTLLPNCRFDAPVYLTNTIRRLLDDYEHGDKRLPRYEKAMLVIDEHCDIAGRKVYDQDNKGWKAVSNVLKGRVIKDDDQFSLHVCLLSEYSNKFCCNIYLIDQQDAELFFNTRNENSQVFP